MELIKNSETKNNEITSFRFNSEGEVIIPSGRFLNLFKLPASTETLKLNQFLPSDTLVSFEQIIAFVKCQPAEASNHKFEFYLPFPWPDIGINEGYCNLFTIGVNLDGLWLFQADFVDKITSFEANTHSALTFPNGLAQCQALADGLNKTFNDWNSGFKINILRFFHFESQYYGRQFQVEQIENKPKPAYFNADKISNTKNLPQFLASQLKYPIYYQSNPGFMNGNQAGLKSDSKGNMFLMPISVQNSDFVLELPLGFYPERSNIEIIRAVGNFLGLLCRMEKTNQANNLNLHRYQHLIDNSLALVWGINTGYGLIMENEAFKRQRNGINGQSELVFPMHHALGLYQDSVWNNAYKKAFEGLKQHFEISFQNDRHLNWWEISLFPIVNVDGKTTDIICAANNITLNKNADQNLLKSERKFRQIFEASRDLYLQTARDGTITVISPSVHDICGFWPEEVEGKNLVDFASIDTLMEMRSKLLELGSLRNVAIETKNRNGETLHLIGNLNLLLNDEGNLEGYELIAGDTSEIRTASDQIIRERKSSASSLKIKEQFLANISHEIRTPVNGIVGAISLLEESYLDFRQRNFVMAAKNSAELLTGILDDMLDVSKIESGKMVVHKNPVGLKSLANKLSSLYSPMAIKRNLGFEIDLDHDLPETVISDENLLMKAFSHLLANAFKFTEAGKVVFELKTINKTERGIIIEAAIIDTGIGIPTHIQRNLFRYFSQADSSLTKKHQGVGLGLAVSKQIINLLNGDISFETKAGAGTSFFIRFNAELPETNSLPPLPISKIETEKPKFSFSREESPHILVVEDNAINRLITSEILIAAGCRVKEAGSGFKALEMLGLLNFDIVLMDVQMPEMDGITTTREIRNLKLQKTPIIIAVTAYAMQGDKERFLAAGMDAYLAKPISGEKLIETVAKEFNRPRGDINRTNATKTEIIATTRHRELAQTDAVLNIEVLNNLRRHVPEDVVLASLHEFETETIGLFKEGWNAIALNDLNLLLSVIHTLKGTSLTIGAEEFGNFAKDLEEKLRNGENMNPQTDFGALQQLFKKVVIAIRDLIPINSGLN